MKKICFNSEERIAKKEGFSAFPNQSLFYKNWSQNNIYTLEYLKIAFSSMDSPNLQL